MPLPRPRFTVRTLMVAVAIVAVVLGGSIERRNRFRKLAALHQSKFNILLERSPCIGFFGGAVDRLGWHETMKFKYDDAARYPFLPVRPDPPEPPEGPID